LAKAEEWLAQVRTSQNLSEAKSERKKVNNLRQNGTGSRLEK
jgi:hypothetical protein